MKKTVIAFLLCISTSGLFAQNIANSIVKSEVFKDEFKHSNIEHVEDDGEGGVLIVRNYNGGMFSTGIGYYFEHYNSNL